MSGSSSWPFKTADELRRALILRIAQVLFDAPDVIESPSPAPAAPAPAEPLAVRIRTFLAADALVLRAPPAPPDPLAEYKALLARLDATLYGGIGKSPQAQVQLGQQETLVAALKGILTMLGTVSPLIGGLRALFGLDAKVELTDLVQREKNEATRDRIESMAGFQKVLKDLFDRKAQGLRVCVFVDDLDRVMPDVALDLLEAIKSLLDGVKCTFIVAADQQLIGQGLKARLRELLDTPDRAQVDAFYNKKGRECFEKIIQLGIRVPEPTAEHAHRFIAAQFPHWLAATDLVEAAIGTNPRRLKQYCNLLDYRFHVSG